MDRSQKHNTLQPLPDGARCVFTGKIFSIYQWEQQLFDGSVAIFEKAVRADSAGVLAVTEHGKILLSEQEQPGMKPFKSLLGGVVDAGETPRQTALRELREEAGYEAATIEPWFAVSPFTKIDWTISLFIARDCRKVCAPSLDAGEKITVYEISFAEFMAVVFDPDFRDEEVTNRVMRMILQPSGTEELQQLLGAK